MSAPAAAGRGVEASLSSPSDDHTAKLRIAGLASFALAPIGVPGVAAAAEETRRISYELPVTGTASLVLGGLVGGTIVGVILTTRLIERILEAGTNDRALDPKRALGDVLSALREAAPVIGLVITLAGGFFSINSRVESLELKIDAQNTRIDAQNVRIDAQNTRIDALNVRAEAELRTLADQTATLRAYNEQIFRLALRQAQEQSSATTSAGPIR